MRPLALPILCSLAALHVDLANAVRLGITGTRVPQRSVAGHQRRASIVGTTGLTNSADIQYNTNITVGGSEFQVIIDTGSSDLYVTGSVASSKDTGKSATVNYAVGSAKGPVHLATLEFAGYTVENQAYIQQTPSGDNAAGTGLIGLGPNFGSQVYEAIGDSSGDAVLDRIFKQNTSTPNYITILLGRHDDPTDTFPGDLTVGEILPGYEAVTSQPQLNVSQVAKSTIANQHWQTLLDADGVIGPDGEAISVTTGVSGTSNKKQLTAVFDSGFSLPQVPSDVAEGIYGKVPGASLENDADVGKIWTLPCDYEINIAFKIGGVTYPVHPLDVSLDLNATDDSGNKICVGAFQPIGDGAKSSTYDMILGMAFLRNAYMYINFGDFVEGKLDQVADPYIQLLSITNDTAEQHSDFLKVRGDAKSWDPSANKVLTWIRHHLALVIGISVGLGVIILVGIASCCLRSRKIRATPAGFVSYQSSYQPLHEPAPPSYDMHALGAGGYSSRPPQQHGNYNNPWDSHY